MWCDPYHACDKDRGRVKHVPARKNDVSDYQSAIMATAHKMARIVYHLLTHRLPFGERSAADHAH